MSSANVVLDLPWPPSLNRYWRHPSRGKLAGRHLISEDGRRYRTAVQAELLSYLGRRTLPLAGRLGVSMFAAPPDRRVRDLDNLPKAVLDSLSHAGLWTDDGQIDRLLIQRAPVEKGGRMRIVVEILPGAP
jgi:crossover junction endodeoxyribonuclease RusA